MTESSRMNPSGVGLGLSICKQLIEHMAGSVNVQSEVGEGTTFTISFKTTALIEDASMAEITEISGITSSSGGSRF